MKPLTSTELAKHLNECRTIAVVGISSDPSRPSHYVSAYMQSKGYRIIPVNPILAANNHRVLGEKCWESLTAIPPDLYPIDMVNCFRKSEDIPQIAEQAISIGAKALWQQLGINNQSASELVTDAGMWAVADQCLMVAHRNLMNHSEKEITG